MRVTLLALYTEIRSALKSKLGVALSSLGLSWSCEGTS